MEKELIVLLLIFMVVLKILLFVIVLYLPDLEKNLLSVRAMIKLGASVEFEGDLRRVTRNSKLLAIGEMYVESYPW